VEILTWPEADVPADLRPQVVALQDQAWPGTEPNGPEPWHDPALRPVSLLLVDDGRVLAALDILSKRLGHRGETYRASGLSTVVTDIAARRRGHGLRLIVAAHEAMRSAGADLAIFTCDADLAPFYERGGYEVLVGAVLVGGTPAEPLPSDRLGKAVLWCPYTPHAEGHAADFRGTRIGLYPGTVDRIW